MARETFYGGPFSGLALRVSVWVLGMALVARPLQAAPFTNRAALYREIEQFRERLPGVELRTEDPKQESDLVRRWLDLVIDEGVFNPGGLYETVPLPRDIWDELKRSGDIEAAAGQLDRFTEYWYADGSVGNIRDHVWQTVAVQAFTSEPGAVRLQCLAGKRPVTLTVRVYTGGVVRVTADEQGFFDDAALTPDAITVRDDEAAVGVKTSWGDLSIAKQPFGVRVTIGGKVLWDEREVRFLLDGDKIKAVRHHARVTPEDRFYGFGERYRQLDYRGSVLAHWQSPSTPSIMRGHYADTYAPIAFTVNPRGMGIFWNSSRRGLFDLGASAPDLFKAVFHGPVFDYYLFFASSPLEVISRYTDITGKPLTPPEWAFKAQMGGGGHRWTLGGKTDKPLDEVEKEVRRMLDLGFPHGSIYIESFGYSDTLKRLLEDNGIRWIAWNCPGFFEPVGWGTKRGMAPAEAERLALHLQDGTRFAIPKNRFLAGKSLVDFTHPQAAEMLGDIARERLERGFRGGMLDDGDDVPPDALCYDGRTGEEMHNLYGYYYTRGFGETLQRLTGGDCLQFARCAGAGSQRYVCQFLGDLRAGFDGTREHIRAGLSFSASGVPNWGGCIGGYSGPPTKEVYIRWTQLGCFSPLMRYHGHQPREPWYFDDETVGVYGFYTWLRVNMLPYMMALARETQRTGIPWVLPLALVYPDDPGTHSIDDAYMFGPSMLAAPMVEGGNARKVYLPAGNWHPFFSDAPPLEGGRTMDVTVALNETAVFVPEGAIIPLRLGRAWKLGAAIDEAETVYRLFPLRTGCTTFQDGDVQIACTREERGIRIRVNGVRGRAGLWVTVEGGAAAVRANGAALDAVADRAAFQKGGSGFAVDGRSVMLRHPFTGDDDIMILKDEDN